MTSSVQFHSMQHGTGRPVLILHGAGVDHLEAQVCFEPVFRDRTGLRRIYPDLPGMGRSTAEGLNGNDDVVRLLGAFVDDLAAGPVLLLGHSYGAYLARGVAADLLGADHRRQRGEAFGRDLRVRRVLV